MTEIMAINETAQCRHCQKPMIEHVSGTKYCSDCTKSCTVFHEPYWACVFDKVECKNNLDMVNLLADADKIVKTYPLYKKLIQGTPLDNDIACFMANFARNRIHQASNMKQVVQICGACQCPIDGTVCGCNPHDA